MMKARRDKEDLEMEGRGEREERMVDIYVSAGSLRGYDPGPEIEPVTAQDMSGGQHGEESRCRAAAVCLGLLCLLLLAAFTSLAVHYVSVIQERNILQYDYKNLTEEKERLQASYNILTREKNQTERPCASCCKDGVNFGCHCYFISSVKKTWEESRRACKDKQSDLMIINSKEEQDFVSSLDRRVWLGLTDREKEGTWMWVDGTPLTMEFWIPRQPDNVNDEDCAEFYNEKALNNRGWNDRPCEEMNEWICEADIS